MRLFLILITGICFLHGSFQAFCMDCMEHMQKAVNLHIQKQKNSFLNQNTYDKIEFHYEKALSLCPDLSQTNADFCNNLANIYFQSGRINKAEKYYKKALAISPDMENALFYLAKIYEKKQFFTLALDCYLKII